MFTTKTESVKASATSAHSPRATTIDDERHQQRDEPGDDRAEDEDQDDERRRQADLELARLQVVLRELVEVVVERAPAGHHDAEAVTAVAALDEAQEPVDVALALDADQHGMPVARDARDRSVVVGRSW